jgi:hypothetical protein
VTPRKRNASPTTPTADNTALYEQLTTALDQGDALAYHVAARLIDLSEEGIELDRQELFALSVIARTIADKHQIALTAASAMLRMGVK